MKSIYNSTNRLYYSYKIVFIAISFILGIFLNEYISSPWLIIGTFGIITAILSLLVRNLAFLLFIPLGLLFSANSQLISGDNILNFSGEKIDLEGVLYRSPETREAGSRLYIQTDAVFKSGVKEPVSGKVIIYTTGDRQVLAYGDRVRILDVKVRPIESFKNPGAFNLKKFYETQGIYARGFTHGQESIISFARDKSYSSILNYIDIVRIKFGNLVRAKIPSPENAILNALTIGDKAGIPQETRTEFSKAGVAHILAISGLHVGAVAITFFFLIKWLLKRSEYLLLRFQVPRLAAGMTILPIFLYTAVAGFSTSTVRAFIMISLYLLSIVIGKQEYRVNTLSAAALLILIWHPWSLFEISFQLSFAAVVGILMAHKFYPFKFNTLRDKFYSMLKTTVAATLVTFPLVANSFGILPLVSIPANLILVPLVEFIIVPLSLISFIGFLISPLVAEILISVNLFFIEMLIFGVEAVLKIPYSSLTIPPMNIVSWVLFVLVVVFLILNSFYSKLKFIIPIVVLGFVLSVINPWEGKSNNGLLNISFLDVGARKSLVFVELPNDKNIVINGAYSKNNGNGYLEKTVVTNYLLNKGVSNIDLLILSSTDKDTLSGAVHLIQKFNVRNLLTSGDKLSGELWELINIHNMKLENLYDIPEPLIFGEVALTILRTGKDFVVDDSSTPRPVAFKIIFSKNSFLIGNLINRSSAQYEMIKQHGRELNSTVLYMPNISLQEFPSDFIEQVAPKLLITGNFNIASGELSETLSTEIGEIEILEIDKDGAVTVTSDGKKLEASSFDSEKELVLH